MSALRFLHDLQHEVLLVRGVLLLNMPFEMGMFNGPGLCDRCLAACRQDGAKEVSLALFLMIFFA